MTPTIPTISSLFRPADRSRAPIEETSVPPHRLLALFGTAFAGLYGVLQEMSSLGGPAPTWPSGSIGVFFAGLFAVSYVSSSERLHRTLAGATRGLLYLLMGWLVVATTLAGFAAPSAAALLFAFAVFPPMIGTEIRSIRPALWLGGFTLSATIVGAVLAPAFDGSPLFLLGCMTAVGLVEGLAATLLFGDRKIEDRTFFDREEPFPSITENVPAALFRTAPGEGIIYANQAFAEMFGYKSVEEVLRMDPNALFAHPEERTRLWTKAREEGGLSGAEVKLKRKDQSVFTGLLSEAVAYDDDGEVTCYDGTVTDVSDQKRREQARRASMTRLARAAESQDYGTTGHVRRVGTLARLLAEALDQPPEWQARIEEAAAFHDVGKICVADRILQKPGPLSNGEREAMKKHTSVGPDLLSDEPSGLARMARRIARSHHERWDGDGYPEGLQGDEIPLAARIVAVADAFDAMTHDRPYRSALPEEEAFSVLQKEAGSQFDPRVSEAALQCREAMAEIVAGDAHRTVTSPAPLEASIPACATPSPSRFTSEPD